MVKCFNPYSSGFSIYLLVKQEVKVLLKKLQSLFTWIFYLFKWKKKTLQSKKEGFNPYSPGFSIYFQKKKTIISEEKSFNPYSPGFSIYFYEKNREDLRAKQLQSLFTWIFYLFNKIADSSQNVMIASILIHLDFLSI